MYDSLREKCGVANPHQVQGDQTYGLPMGSVIERTKYEEKKKAYVNAVW